MDLEATEKWIEAEDCQLATQREHEKEAHNLQMFCLHLQYQGAVAAGTGQFGMSQFGGATGNDTANPGDSRCETL